MESSGSRFGEADIGIKVGIPIPDGIGASGKFPKLFSKEVKFSGKGADKRLEGYNMSNIMGALASAGRAGNLQAKTGWVRSSAFRHQGYVVLKFGRGVRSPLQLLLDTGIPHIQAENIKSWINQGSTAAQQSMPAAQLQQLVPGVNLKSGRLKAIVVSPKFWRNNLREDGAVIALTLKSVAPAADRFVQTRALAQFADARTAVDGVDRAFSGGETAIDVGYSVDSGGKLFEALVHNSKLFPLKAKDVYKRDGSQFSFWLMDKVGETNVGVYEAELAIAREMFRLGEINLGNLAGMALAVKGQMVATTKGEALKSQLVQAGSAYLNKFYQQLQRKAIKECGKRFQRLLSECTRAQLDVPELDLRDGVAILTLGYFLKKLDWNEIIQYLKGQFNREVHRYLTEVKAYLKSEEDRIFTLGLVIDYLTGKANA